jgi:branched-subunit amino acid transport protein
MSLDGTVGRIALVLAVALVTYLTRLAGFRLRLRRGDGADEAELPAPIERFLGYVPIAAFAALVAPGVVEGSGDLAARLAAVACAAVAALRLRRLWLSIAAGLAGYWLIEGVGRLV